LIAGRSPTPSEKRMEDVMKLAGSLGLRCIV
jgi:hypothetical protein